MTEKFSFDFFQIPATGVEEPDLAAARSSVGVEIRRPASMKLSNFGALEVGSRLSSDYTRTNTMAFKAKGDSEDWLTLSEDTGVGQGVQARGVSVSFNPLIWGSSVKYVRDDQFIRMTMSRNSGTTTAAGQIDQPKFDVMDEDVASAAGIIASTNASTKNWPSEGWRSLGGKYDFLPYDGGTLK